MVRLILRNAMGLEGSAKPCSAFELSNSICRMGSVERRGSVENLAGED